MAGGLNRPRGEVALEAGGTRYRLCLTLGALAEIESALGVSGFAALAARLADPKAQDLIAILAALLRGGGHDLDTDEVGRLPVDMPDAVTAIGEALNAAAGGGEGW